MYVLEKIWYLEACYRIADAVAVSSNLSSIECERDVLMSKRKGNEADDEHDNCIEFEIRKIREIV